MAWVNVRLRRKFTAVIICSPTSASSSDRSETGEVKGEGQPGELVYTPLDARGTVVLRYRTGDYVDSGITWKRVRIVAGPFAPSAATSAARATRRNSNSATQGHAH